MARKSYNPFKMWGSYILILPAIFILNIFRTSTSCSDSHYPSPPNSNAYFVNEFVDSFGGFCISWREFGNPFDNSGNILYILGVIIVFFILGWGIHSLIRRLRK